MDQISKIGQPAAYGSLRRSGQQSASLVLLPQLYGCATRETRPDRRQPGWKVFLKADRRLVANQSGKRQSVIIMRERGGKSLAFVAQGEAAGVPAIKAHVVAGAVVHADEASHWDSLHGRYAVHRINHSVSYSDGDACTNQAESYFSRLRRAELGVHHHIAGPYLNAYATEMTWREDNRRVSNGSQAVMVGSAAMASRVSRK